MKYQKVMKNTLINAAGKRHGLGATNKNYLNTFQNWMEISKKTADKLSEEFGKQTEMLGTSKRGKKWIIEN